MTTHDMIAIVASNFLLWHENHSTTPRLLLFAEAFQGYNNTRNNNENYTTTKTIHCCCL